MKDRRNLLLIIYFILIHLFGFLSSHTEVLSEFSDSSTIYLFAGFPVFFVIYNINLYRVSAALERNYPDLFRQYEFKNPLKKNIDVVSPNFFFSNAKASVDETLQQTFKTTKLALLLALCSFLMAITILVI